VEERTVDEMPDTIGSDDITKESGLDEPNVPGAPAEHAEPVAPATGAAADETGGHTMRPSSEH
jgi:hypothetical protein